MLPIAAGPPSLGIVSANLPAYVDAGSQTFVRGVLGNAADVTHAATLTLSAHGVANARPNGVAFDTQRAIDVADRSGAARVSADAASLLGRLGGSPVARAASGAADLTPGELRVVELAATGMTNREIAQALFVTVKAVEWHLSNAYPKLGIRGRRELSAVFRDS